MGEHGHPQQHGRVRDVGPHDAVGAEAEAEDQADDDVGGDARIADHADELRDNRRGEVELLHAVPKDQIEAMMANPDVKVTPNQAFGYYYMNFDSSGRSALSGFSIAQPRDPSELAGDYRTERPSTIELTEGQP